MSIKKNADNPPPPPRHKPHTLLLMGMSLSVSIVKNSEQYNIYLHINYDLPSLPPAEKLVPISRMEVEQ